jgi:hypothetical protein
VGGRWYSPREGKGQPFASRVVTPWSEESIGGYLRATVKNQSTADQAWTANLLMAVPFHVAVPGYTVYEGFVMCGTGAGGNVDIAVLDLAGNRLTSSGPTARAASVSVATTTMADFPLAAGDYYMAISADGVAALSGGAAVGIGLLEAAGVCQMASAYPIPSVVTLAVNSIQANLPMFGLTQRTVAP